VDYKSVPQFTKSIDDRTVTGIFAVHGNVDEGNDRSWPGSFGDVQVNGRNRAKFLWQHDSFAPPIATIKSIREVNSTELPPSVRSFAPDATGGVEVVREYLDTPRGNEVLSGIKSGAIDEMSYAYDVTKYDIEKVGDQQVRNIRAVKLFDISDVNWGMNSATVGSKSFLGSGRSFEAHSELVVSAVEEFLARVDARLQARVKEGRVLSQANVTHINDHIETLRTSATKLEEMLKQATNPKSDPQLAKALFLEWQRMQAHLNGVEI
jgi:HK97 family phage prohead protease